MALEQPVRLRRPRQPGDQDRQPGRKVVAQNVRAGLHRVGKGALVHAVGAEDTAVARRWAQELPAAAALVEELEELTRILGHRPFRLGAARRRGEHRHEADSKTGRRAHRRSGDAGLAGSSGPHVAIATK
jgi:hypothetical protein